MLILKHLALNKIISILLILISFNASCQRPVLGLVSRMPGVPLIIIMAGESNAGGLAANSSATAPELATRTIKILNNTTLATFDFLNIGTNNLVNHVGLNYADNDAHGWELQLANSFDARAFGNRPVYIVKIAQGGTTAAMWADEATYSAESQTIEPFDVAIARIQAAIHLADSIHNKTPDVVMWWSLGINDIGIATDPGTYEDQVMAVFTAMRTEIGIEFPIIQTQFQSIDNTLDASISNIATGLDDVYVVNTTGAETSQVFDGSGTHWGYTGMKQVASSLISLTLTILQ